MNASDAKKPKFEADWWKANKANNADLKMALEKALTKYEAQRTSSFKDSNNSRPPELEKLKEALRNVKKEALAEKGNRALGTFQKETIDALANYAKIADAALSELGRLDSAPIMKESVSFLVKKAPQFEEYCKKTHRSENFNFLNLMYKGPKKEKQWYEDFIKADAKFQVNLKAPTVKAFDDIAKAVANGSKPDNPDTWGKAPWGAAVEEVEFMVDKDVVRGFRYYMFGVMMKDKLP